MLSFNPIRTSPEATRPRTAAFIAADDISRSSAVSIPELTGLTQEDISIIDAIIERAAPAATTFLSVFKAYSDVLQERGLDPHEVVYYGKLLKLGTLKGKNWGEKWRMVRQQHGYTDNPNNSDVRTKRLSALKTLPPLTRNPPLRNLQPTPSSRDNDNFTLHSHQDGTDLCPSVIDDDTQSQPSQTRRAPWSALRRNQVPSSQADSVLDSDIRSVHSLPSRPSHPMKSGPPRSAIKPASRVSYDHADATSTVPPSYRAAVNDKVHRPTSDLLTRPRSKSEYPPPSANVVPAPLAAHQAIEQARKRTGAVVNENEAWKKIQMVRDEKAADKYREDVLVERFWDVWKRGHQWVITTNEQVGRARDIHLMRLAIQRWREMTASRRVLYRRASNLANARRLKAAFARWRHTLKAKRQTAWREGMRTKMNMIRENRNLKLRKDAWAKWRQSYRSHLSGQHYAERLVLRFLRRWKERLYRIDHLEAVADGFLDGVVKGRVETYWDRWKASMDIRGAERIITERVDLRVMGDALKIWRKRLHDCRTADMYHAYFLKRHIMWSWKTARDRIRSLERRADKHIARQDDVLIRAIVRVWKARERGVLLERVKTVRLLKESWSTWVQRIQYQARLEDLATAFSQRSDRHSVLIAFRVWCQVLASHRNAHSFAVRYHAAQSQFKHLLGWRIKLRTKLKMVKQGRIAEKFFIARNAWTTWTRKIAEKRRERKLQEFDRQKLRKVFEAWLQRTQQAVQRRHAEQTIQRLSVQHILRTALTRWTNRVIEVKLRELEIAQRNELRTLTFAFNKWKAVCIRHVEELSLMESYQYVKREESIRRMFHHWLTAARASRHRRITLLQREDEVKRGILAYTWDKWRDRYSDEKLRPLEYDFLIQRQNILLFRTFAIWRSNTKSIPAIRFQASHLKAKFWQHWRGAMPRALQARKAREVDRKATLARVFDTWVQTYRTKVALKAVARARYLRLPTASRPAQSSRPVVATANRYAISRGGIGGTEGSNNSRLESGRDGLSREPKRAPDRSSLFSARPRSEASPPRPSRDSDLGVPDHLQAHSESNFDLTPPRKPVRWPAPSGSAGGERPGRSRLWLELQSVQRKPRLSKEPS